MTLLKLNKLISAALLFFCLLSLATAQNNKSLAELLSEGEFYYKQGDCQLSQYIFQIALEQDPNNVTALLGKGRGLVCQGAVAEGIEVIRQAVAEDTTNMTSYVRLASAYVSNYNLNPQANQNSLETALTIVTTGEGISNTDARLYNIKGIIYYELGDYSQSSVALEQAVNYAQGMNELSKLDLSRIHVNLGRSYRALGQFQRAEEAFRQSVTLDPSNAEGRNYLGETIFLQGDCERGIFELEQAVSLVPNDFLSIANLGMAKFECNQKSEATPYLQRALDIDGVSLPLLYTYLARSYLEQDNFDEALREAQKGVLLPSETNNEAFYWLGQIYEAIGNFQLAQQTYGKALELYPNDANLNQALNSLP